MSMNVYVHLYIYNMCVHTPIYIYVRIHKDSECTIYTHIYAYVYNLRIHMRICMRICIIYVYNLSKDTYALSTYLFISV